MFLRTLSSWESPDGARYFITGVSAAVSFFVVMRKSPVFTILQASNKMMGKSLYFPFPEEDKKVILNSKNIFKKLEEP